MTPTASENRLPRYTALIPLMLGALQDLGGSASIAQLREAAIKRLQLSDEQVNAPYGDRTVLSKLRLKLTWTRTILKNAGLISNPEKGVWALRDPQLDIRTVEPCGIDRDMLVGLTLVGRTMKIFE